MDLLFIRSTGMLQAGDSQIRAWSKVRNELNGYRPNKEKNAAGNSDVFYITRSDGSRGSPSMPRPFPAGKWKITGINEHPDKINDGYLYPFYIATDAFQPLDVWELDNRGFYLQNTNKKENDYAYGIHFSTSDWTQGCLRVETENDIRWLVKNVAIGDAFNVI